MSADNLPSFLTPDNLVVKPPVKTNSILNFPRETIASDAKATHILTHPRYPDLLNAFLSHKRAHGSAHERALYADLTWQQLAARLLHARPMTFMGSNDATMLRDGTILDSKACQEWDRNGTDMQHFNTHLTLEHYLSYDEIMLSSLLGVSGPSFFINTGSRGNCARPSQKGSFQDRGIIIGLVGARFERKHRMDSVHILPPPHAGEKTPPLQDPAVSAMIRNFFGAQRDATLDFDKAMYRGRCRVTADMFLLEANARAQEADKKAHAYVVGLGLGVWQYYHQQREWYVSVFEEAIAELDLDSVGTVEFAYIQNLPEEVEQSVIDTGLKKGIKVLFSRRDPAEKLEGDELLVLSYAWDGNAFPGNEYWTGSLAGSGDPAAACMSTIGELHNVLVNPELTNRIKVAGQGGYA
ncbi:hypothetical protein Q7P37_011317 [Cladosporium fusiforme]